MGSFFGATCWYWQPIPIVTVSVLCFLSWIFFSFHLYTFLCASILQRWNTYYVPGIKATGFLFMGPSHSTGNIIRLCQVFIIYYAMLSILRPHLCVITHSCKKWLTLNSSHIFHSYLFPFPNILSLSFFCTLNPVFINIYWHCLIACSTQILSPISGLSLAESKQKKFNLFFVFLFTNSQMYFDSFSGIFQNESSVISDEIFPLNCGFF